MTSTHVKVNRALSVPPVAFDLPLAGNHRGSVTIAPPSSHLGIAPVLMRLISYDLREGQVVSSLFSSHSSDSHQNQWITVQMKSSLLCCKLLNPVSYFSNCIHSLFNPLSPGQRDTAVSLPCWGGSHLFVTGAKDQATALVSLHRHPLSRRRVCGPNLQVPWGEMAEKLTRWEKAYNSRRLNLNFTFRCNFWLALWLLDLSCVNEFAPSLPPNMNTHKVVLGVGHNELLGSALR